MDEERGSWTLDDVSDYLVTPGIKLTKFGKPVVLMSERKVGTLPHIRFVQYEVKGTEARASIEYKVQGVHATFALVSDSAGSWKVTEVELVLE